MKTQTIVNHATATETFTVWRTRGNTSRIIMQAPTFTDAVAAAEWAMAHRVRGWKAEIRTQISTAATPPAEATK